MTFALELDIAETPTAVFDFVADFATTPQWYSAVQRVERVRGTGGIGTQYDIYRNLPTGPAVNLVHVTSYLAGREVTFTSVSGPTPFQYRYRIQPRGSETRLQLEGTISAQGLPGIAAAFAPLAERLFKRGMHDNLRTLAAILERKSPH